MLNIWRVILIMFLYESWQISLKPTKKRASFQSNAEKILKSLLLIQYVIRTSRFLWRKSWRKAMNAKQRLHSIRWWAKQTQFLAFPRSMTLSKRRHTTSSSCSGSKVLPSITGSYPPTKPWRKLLTKFSTIFSKRLELCHRYMPRTWYIATCMNATVQPTRQFSPFVLWSNRCFIFHSVGRWIVQRDDHRFWKVGDTQPRIYRRWSPGDVWSICPWRCPNAE